VRFPVGSTGTKEEFERDWYDAQPFGRQTSYGYHEGADINKRTGGDTDINQELKAIAPGRLVYYHYLTHPTSGFGRHLVYKINGPWGSRWVMYSHMSELDFLKGEQDVNEGQIVGRIGKSGTTVAHLHWSIYKEDPVGFGIDNIANNLDELNRLWEDPVQFVNTWLVAPVPVPVPSPVTDQSLYNFGPAFGILELQAARSILNDQKNQILSLQNQVTNAQNDYNALRTQYNSLKNRIRTSVNTAIDQTN